MKIEKQNLENLDSFDREPVYKNAAFVKIY